MEVVASENEDGEISGSGTYTYAGDSFAFSLDGIHSHPDVTFTARATGFEDFNFSGQFVEDDPDVVRGELNGSGFVNTQLTLRR